MCGGASAAIQVRGHLMTIETHTSTADHVKYFDTATSTTVTAAAAAAVVPSRIPKVVLVVPAQNCVLTPTTRYNSWAEVM